VDKASVSEAEDRRFESGQGRFLLEINMKKPDIGINYEPGSFWYLHEMTCKPAIISGTMTPQGLIYEEGGGWGKIRNIPWRDLYETRDEVIWNQIRVVKIKIEALKDELDGLYDDLEKEEHV
jgi:hypothetical protein